MPFRLTVILLAIQVFSVTVTADLTAPFKTLMCTASELVFPEDFTASTVSSGWSFKAEFALRDGALLPTDVDPTPNIDQLADEGLVYLDSFCANSICGSSRATILTGKHSYKNAFMRNGNNFDQKHWTVAKALQEGGYNTAVIGKWHLKSNPVGFDHWKAVPGLGSYYNPVFMQQDGPQKRFEGYATDLTTQNRWTGSTLELRANRSSCCDSAKHRTFAPALRHLGAFDDQEILATEINFDEYQNRSKTLAKSEMEIDRHFDCAYDAEVRKNERGGVILPKPDRYGPQEYNRMTPSQKAKWETHFGPHSQQFLANYKSGMLSHKEVVLGKYRRCRCNYLTTVKSGSVHIELIQNIDYVPTFLDIAGLMPSADIQRKSLVPLLKGNAKDWRESLDYAYYELGEHVVPQHFGVRTLRYNLFYLPQSGECNMFDLQSDPHELVSVHEQPAHELTRNDMHAEYTRLRQEYEALPFPPIAPIIGPPFSS